MLSPDELIAKAKEDFKKLKEGKITPNGLADVIFLLILK